jgi:antitoxin component YwqK of YwqJK toxin-antitoxin module
MRGPIVVLLAACLAFPLGCANTGTAQSDPPRPTQPAPDSGPTGSERMDSMVESMIVGAMVGSIFGPIGAAAGAVGLALYGAITGSVPLSGGRSRGGRGSEAEAEDEMEREIEAEMAKQDALEAEIEAELKRQEELLKQIDRDEKLREAEQAAAAGSGESASLDPTEAPRAPKKRDLPASLFDEEPRTIEEGEWGNEDSIDVVARSLDADRDGAPEEVRYHDAKTGVIVRAEVQRDTDGDGKVDEWQTFGRDGRMVRREVDRNGNGVRDAFYIYEGDSLVEERHDGNSDGQIDRIVRYEGRAVASSEEDLDRDGRMDTWTYFENVGGRAQVSRVERDTSGDGKPDTFETYEQIAGKPSLKQRDEDKNGDGTIDIKSVYENGKLKQREISDPALMPL